MSNNSFWHTCDNCGGEQEIEYEADGYKVLGVFEDDAVCPGCGFDVAEDDLYEEAQQAHWESLADLADSMEDDQ